MGSDVKRSDAAETFQSQQKPETPGDIRLDTRLDCTLHGSCKGLLHEVGILFAAKARSLAMPGVSTESLDISEAKSEMDLHQLETLLDEFLDMNISLEGQQD